MDTRADSKALVEKGLLKHMNGNWRCDELYRLTEKGHEIAQQLKQQ